MTSNDGDVKEAPLTIGEEVWVKPPQARCTARWSRGLVTDVNSRNNISVNGVPRHIHDVRRVVSVSEELRGMGTGWSLMTMSKWK